MQIGYFNAWYRYALKTAFKMSAAGGWFLLPVPVWSTKLSPGTHNTFAYQILSKSYNAQLICRNLNIFNMAAVRRLGFHRKSILTYSQLVKPISTDIPNFIKIFDAWLRYALKAKLKMASDDG